MNHIVITSPGYISADAFKYLGVSTARGKASSIGMFGSGAKQAVLLLFRLKIPFKVFSGLEEIQITTRPQTIHGIATEVLIVNNEPTSLTLESGAMDWKRPSQAFRELMTNALDQGAPINSILRMTEEVQGFEEISQIFIEAPFGSEMFQAASKAYKMFLHYEGKETAGIIPKEPSTFRAFRKGVLVAEDKHPSLFDYNDAGGLTEIDESRTMTSSKSVMIRAALMACDDKARNAWIERVFTYMQDRNADIKMLAEAHLSQYGLPDNMDVKMKNKIREHYDFFATEQAHVLHAEEVGARPYVARNNAFFDSLASDALPTGRKFFTKKPTDYEAIPLPNEFDRIFKNIWNLMSRSFTPEWRNTAPKVVGFHDAGTRLGFVQDGTIWLNVDQISWNTCVEEIIHLTTGASDCTRQMQEAYNHHITSLLKQLTPAPQN